MDSVSGKLGLNNRFAGISDPQIDELPFQNGTPLDLPKIKEKQDVKDLCRKILFLHCKEEDYSTCLASPLLAS